MKSIWTSVILFAYEQLIKEENVVPLILQLMRIYADKSPTQMDDIIIEAIGNYLLSEDRINIIPKLFIPILKKVTHSKNSLAEMYVADVIENLLN